MGGRHKFQLIYANIRSLNLSKLRWVEAKNSSKSIRTLGLQLQVGLIGWMP